MTEESSSVDNIPGHYRCPHNGRDYSQVATVTLLHHLKQPWQWNLGDRHYYFCTDPDCDVVYFGNDDSVIGQSDLRTCVGLKDPSAADPAIKAFVQQQTRRGSCACRTRNPSGRCCLKDFLKN